MFCDEVTQTFRDMQRMPSMVLPDHWYYSKLQIRQTTPEAWKKVFAAEIEAAKDEVDKENFKVFYKIVEIAEECGATNIIFRVRKEQIGTTFSVRVLYLEEVVFPEENENQSRYLLSYKLSKLRKE